MKYLFWSVSLFLFFVGVLSGVNYLDTQSTHYVECAHHQAAVAESPFLSENDRQNLIEKLNAPEATFELNGKTCPSLLASHKAEIKARLEQRQSPQI